MLASLIHQHPERSYESGRWRADVSPCISMHFAKLQRPESLKEWVGTTHWWNSNMKPIPNLILFAAGADHALLAQALPWYSLYFAQQNCVPLQFAYILFFLGSFLVIFMVNHILASVDLLLSISWTSPHNHGLNPLQKSALERTYL